MFFAAATGLRPGEWIALEHRDLDRDARVVYIRRAYRNGRLKTTKTEASMRAVPLQALALDALDRLPANGSSPLVFPSPTGGYVVSVRPACDLCGLPRGAGCSASRATE